MKRLLATLLLSICSTFAVASIDYYEGNGLYFPDEASPNGLPEAIPCTFKTAYTGQRMLNCTWLGNARYVFIWDAQRKQDTRYNNQMSGMCQRGKCRVNNGFVGGWNEDLPFLLSIWYNIGVSTDGKPVAYRHDATRQVSYAEAGQLLLQFYLDVGIPDKEIRSTFDKRYEGGYQAFADAGGHLSSDPMGQAVKVSAKQPAQQQWPEVKSAWCNPQMDDDCYINEKKVPIANLGKWLPAVAESNIDQIGGHCETILCFDDKDEPVGYLLQ
ncbi:hypothetical protein D3C76_25220 [compost metagenome]